MSEGSNDPRQRKVLNVLFDDRYGGPPKRVIEVAEVLSMAGVETTVCLPEGSGNASEAALGQNLNVLRVAFSRIPNPGDISRVIKWLFHFPGDVWRFFRILRREKPDIVHVNGAFFLPPAFGAKLARIPVVWHLNDTVVPPKAAVVLGLIVHWLADIIVVSAEAVGRHYGLERTDYSVIYPPVNVDRFKAVNGSAARKRGDVPRIALVANWNRIKGIEYFIRAAAIVRGQFSNVEFHFVGARFMDNQETYSADLERLIEELELRSNVVYHGFVIKVEEVLKDISILVLSSFTEAFPMALLEAMACSIPVVATNVGGVRELLLADVAHPAGILVPARNPEAMANAIIRLLNNTEERLFLGANGRRSSQQSFSLEVCAKRHRDVYDRVFGRRVCQEKDMA
jgi:glycosyltransferase involved in cell wall biosynthesis